MTVTIIPGFRCLPLPAIQLSLAVVLQCGQSFRWAIFPLQSNGSTSPDLPQHEYRLCLRDRVVSLRQNATHVFYKSTFAQPCQSQEEENVREGETLTWLRDYFQLDVDLVQLYDTWAKCDPVFERLKDRFSGVRVLRQDPFECLLSFICSSNNNIVRINKMVKSLCSEFSPPLVVLPPPSDGIVVDTDMVSYYPFPQPSVLAAPEVVAKLRTLGFGYRAEFLQKTAKMLVDIHGTPTSPDNTLESAEVWLKDLRNKSTSDARVELLKFVGVGRKVADCVLLMSLDKREVVPVDTHVHQIAVKHYKMQGSSKSKVNMTPRLYEEVSNRFLSTWGEYAGWAHSVLFTSDLKSFASHGISPPTSSEAKSILPELTPSKRPKKRARSPKTAAVKMTQFTPSSIPGEDASTSELHLSLVDRVKRRRRTVEASKESRK